MGRWLQEDSIGVADGRNLYQFNGSNPLSYSDPTGLCPIRPSNCPAGYSTAAGALLGPALERVAEELQVRLWALLRDCDSVHRADLGRWL